MMTASGKVGSSRSQYKEGGVFPEAKREATSCEPSLIMILAESSTPCLLKEMWGICHFC